MTISQSDRSTLTPEMSSTLTQVYRDTDLLLIGRSGNGRSATGNSILGKDAFMVDKGATSQAVSGPVGDSGVVSGGTFTVVDGLNLGENNSEGGSNIAGDICALIKSYQLSKEGFSAVVIVLKFGVPYSLEETIIMKTVKTIIGENVIRDFGICVVTHGDHFQQTLSDKEEGFKDFDQWCRTQDGDLKNLFEECKFRCVLFNNETELASERKSQISKLYGFLEQLAKDRLRGFSQTGNGNSKMSQLKKETSFIEEGTSLILENIRDELDKTEQLQYEEEKSILESMLTVLSDLSTAVKQSDEDSLIAHSCIVRIRALSKEISGRSENLGHRGNPTEIKDNTADLRQGDMPDADEHKELFRQTFQSESMPEMNITGASTVQAALVRGVSANDFTGLLLNEKKKCSQNPTEFVSQSEEKIKSLRNSMEEVEEEFERAKTIRNTKLQHILQETQDFEEKLQAGSDLEPKFKQLQSDISELRKNLESKLEIPVSGGDPHVHLHERQVEVIQPRGDINLLLIGRTGEGKSATGNSILRRRAFRSKASTVSVTYEIQMELCEFEDRIIRVVDSPFFFLGTDDMDKKTSATLLSEQMEMAIAAIPRGYHAFLFVARYCLELTPQDLEEIMFFSRIFSDNFIKKHCILLLTCGDKFDVDREEHGLSFEEWWDERRESFRDLLNECNKRAILFDNTTRDETKQYDQLARLIKMVDNLCDQSSTYNYKDFRKAQDANMELEGK